MKFKQFLNENRSKPLKEEQSYELIKKHCKQAYNAFRKRYIIYRGLKDNGDFLFIDPSKFERKSKNTENYYTWIVDNSPNWKDYPKRSKSIICTTSPLKSASYGNVYIVFPYDGSKVGICPTDDFWFSFKNTLGENNSLSYFNYRLDRIAQQFEESFQNTTTYKQFLKIIEKLDAYMKDEEWDYPFLPPFENQTENSLLKNLQKLLAPKPNGFKVTKNFNDIPIYKGGDGQELWTDGKCILIEKYSEPTLIEYIEG